MELGCASSATSSTQLSSFAFLVRAASPFVVSAVGAAWPFVAPVVSFNVDWLLLSFYESGNCVRLGTLGQQMRCGSVGGLSPPGHKHAPPKGCDDLVPLVVDVGTHLDDPAVRLRLGLAN